MSAAPIPLIPENAPFSAPQRAWLNGFLAGLYGGTGAVGATPAPAEPEDFPWHDPALELDERMVMAEGRPLTQKLMAAMGQLDCGQCGYLCQSYAEALAHKDELTGPYATVIDIDDSKLPSAAEVNGWTSEQYTSALRHDESNPAYNPSFRQLLHVGFKIAAKMGPRYIEALEANEDVIAKNVTENLFERHIKPVFLGA